MSKKINTQNNLSEVFTIKGFTSILIGGYILAGTYALKYLLSTSSPFKENISTNSQVSALLFLILIATTITLYVMGKKNAEKLNIILWNTQTKTIAKKYFIGISTILIALIIVFSSNFYGHLSPIFLLMYGVFILLIKTNKHKNSLIIPGICILLAAYCFIIPSYWYSSLSILGIAYITYGVVIKD